MLKTDATRRRPSIVLELENHSRVDPQGIIKDDTLQSRLSGQRMGDRDALMKEFAKELRLPAYFGHNWDALDECLRDLEWLPARHHVIVIDAPHLVLVNERAELPLLVDSLEEAAQSWGRRPSSEVVTQKAYSFTTILLCTSDDVEITRQIWRNAQAVL